MTDAQFPGNAKNPVEQRAASRAAKAIAAQQPEVQENGPSIQGEVIIRKKTIGRRLKEIFFGGDFKNAARYVAAEVALPAVRNMVVDTVSKGVERVIFGPDRSSSVRSGRTSYGGRTQYSQPIVRSYSSVMLPHQPPYLSRNARQQADDIILSSREDCEATLEYLGNCIDKDGVALLSDLLNFLGRPWKFTDQKWGWSFIGNAEVVQIREGWLLDLPPMEPIQ